MPNQENVTQLLLALSEGNQATVNDLLPLVYDELRKMAASYMRRERPDHTLQPTALVNEAYLRLVEGDVAWEGRRHFYGIAARAMRQVLVDHARKHQAAKRGAGRRADKSVSKVADPVGGGDIDVLALHLA